FSRRGRAARGPAATWRSLGYRLETILWAPGESPTAWHRVAATPSQGVLMMRTGALIVLAAGLIAALASVTATAGLRSGPSPQRAQARTPTPRAAAAKPAGLGGLGQLACAGGSSPIQHVIYIQFDNTHLLRDRPGVPSDLEQMPNLLNFMKQNGT